MLIILLKKDTKILQFGDEVVGFVWHVSIKHCHHSSAYFPTPFRLPFMSTLNCDFNTLRFKRINMNSQFTNKMLNIVEIKFPNTLKNII